MNLNSLWFRIPFGALCMAGLAYAVYRLYVQAVGSTDGAIIVGIVLAAWLLTYLIFRKKLTAWLRNPN